MWMLFCLFLAAPPPPQHPPSSVFRWNEKLLCPVNLPQLVWLLGWYTLCVFFSKYPFGWPKVFSPRRKMWGGGGGKEHACLLRKQNSQCLFFCFFFFSSSKSHNKLPHKHNPRWNQGERHVLVSEIPLHIRPLLASHSYLKGELEKCWWNTNIDDSRG